MSKCYTSDTGNSDDVQVGKHKWDKDGYCIFCGVYKEEKVVIKVEDDKRRSTKINK